MSWRLAPLLCLLIAAACLIAEPPGDKADAFERIQAVAPPGPSKRLEPKKHDVIEWILGPQRQRERKRPRKAGRHALSGRETVQATTPQCR